MKIETKLTDRDKKILVFITMAAVAAVFIMLIIMPLHSANSYMKQQIAENEIRMMEMQQKVAMLPSVQTVHADDKARLELSQQNIYPLAQSRDVDELMTSLMMKHGLSVRRLGITMPEASVNMTAYLHGDGAPSNPDGVDALYQAQVSLRVSGTPQAIHSFLDELALDMEAVRIEQLNWNEERYQADVVPGGESQQVLDAELAVYMSNKDSSGE